MPTLKQIIQKKKMRELGNQGDTNAFMLAYMEDFLERKWLETKDKLLNLNQKGNNKTDDKIEDIETRMDDLEHKFEKNPTGIPLTDEAKIERIATKLAVKMATLERGFTGEMGHTPTREELLTLIRPLIPIVKDGYTPTIEELTKLITPLIPQVKDGEDGSPDTPPQIATKLNTLTEAIEQKVIKGFDATIKGLLKAISDTRRGNRREVKSGGGMGDTKFQTFNVSSATTTLTLNETPASDGKALILIYQGQVLENESHFTISGNIISLTFTPSDSTAIFAWLIRG